jgi:putative methanogenesis marker protein 3
MLIKVNDVDVNLPEGSTVEDAISITKAPYSSGAIVSIIKGKKEFEKNVNKYKLKTSKGSIIIEMLMNKDANPLIETWKNKYKEFEKSKIRWITSNEIAIGSVVTDLKPSMDEFKYKQSDVILSLSGFSNESTHIIIIKEDSKGVYGVPNFNKGVFAKIVGGKRTLNLLTDKDDILSIEPVIERNSITESAAISNLDTILEEGNQIFTYVLIEPDKRSPESVEHLYSLIENDKLKVDYESNSFIGFYKMQGLGKDPEYSSLRKRGTVTLRNTGKGTGKVYIYREDRVESQSHTSIGFIKKGMELVDMANFGDYITIKSDPERIMTLNMTQKEANDLLSFYNVKQERNGVLDDDALIVTQDPPVTLKILENHSVKTVGVKKEDLTLINITDNAPRSTWYFKKVTGLVEKPIGSLKVHFAFPGMKLAIFEGDSKEAKGLIPENIPDKSIIAGTIGITNMSKKNVGLIGIRFEDNDEFGPTAEPFNATNIVGKITTDLKNLEKLKENDVLYIKEV